MVRIPPVDFSGLSFAEQTVPPNRVSNPSYLTTSGNLGTEPGEVSTGDFDDVDDYNEFGRIVTTSRPGDFKEEVEVYYVRSGNLLDALNYQTYLKRIDVRVANTYIGTPDQTITLSTVIAYR